MNEELAFKAAFLEKQSQELDENIERLSSQLLELAEFSKDLSFLEKSKNKESLASLGKGVYIKTNLQEKDLFVNVGAGVVVQKSIPETQKIIHGQIKSLTEARMQLAAQAEMYNHALNQVAVEMNKPEKAESSDTETSEKKPHIHDKNCNHQHKH